MTTENPQGEPQPNDQPGYGYPPPPGYAQYDPPQYGTPGPYAQYPQYPQYPGQSATASTAARRDYAHWGLRVGGFLIDWLVGVVPYGIVAAVGAAANSGGLIALGWLVWLVITVWNLWRQGVTGYSVGKQVVGIKLIREADGQPIGGWMSIARQFVHILDALPCYIGFLWPIWDDKKQTFADKVMSTVVVRQAR